MTKTFLTAALGAILAAAPALAELTVSDAYMRRVPPTAPSGAAFMVIENSGEEDRLIDVRSDAAERVELHTHIDMGEGRMQMTEDEDGFEIPAGEGHALARGGDHVMFLGLGDPMSPGDTVSVTLVFEKAGEITVDIPLDNERMPEGHGDMNHGEMNHGDMNHGSMDHGSMKHGN